MSGLGMTLPCLLSYSQVHCASGWEDRAIPRPEPPTDVECPLHRDPGQHEEGKPGTKAEQLSKVPLSFLPPRRQQCALVQLLHSQAGWTYTPAYSQAPNPGGSVLNLLDWEDSCSTVLPLSPQF